MAASELPSQQGASLIELIPWDPDSPSHVERLRLQRVACGWKEDKVEDWRKFQREGDLVFYWIVLGPKHPDRLNLIRQHMHRFSCEGMALQDSCRFVLRKERAPSGTEFLPIGHICLDGCLQNHEDNRLMISPENGVYTIGAFYVSEVLQRLGLGGLAMSALEEVAVRQFGATTLTLDTLSKEDCAAGSPRMVALNRPTTKVNNVDWYQNRGYVVYDVVEDGVTDVDSKGNIWRSTLVFLKKDIT